MQKRAGNVELLRFIFSICIVLHHAIIPQASMWGGYLSVEFFYILSGIFLGRSILKKQLVEPSTEKIVKESWEYCKRRIVGILPYFAVATFIGFFVWSFTYDWRFDLKMAFNIFNDFLFLQSYGLPVASITGVVWYLSSMFFGLWLVYPIARRYYAIFAQYISPIMAVTIMGILIYNYGNLSVPATYMFGIVCTGNLRAVGMISLGIFVNEMSMILARRKCCRKEKTILTGIAILLYVFIIYYMHIWNDKIGSYDEIAVFAMAVALCISVSGQSIFNMFLDNRVNRFLGKYSVSLFLSHFYWVQNIDAFCKKVGWHGEKINIKLIGVMLSCITALLVMFLGNVLRKHALLKLDKQE